MSISERQPGHARPRRAKQRGAMAVEFALVILWFLTLIFGAIDLSRWMYAIDASQEAAREAARTAVVCSVGSAGPALRASPALVTMISGTTTVNYIPEGCCASLATCSTACEGVEVRLTGYEVPSIAWVFPSMPVPPVTTYLTRESMDSTSNSLCAG
jgi:TadE-like protein